MYVHWYMIFLLPPQMVILVLFGIIYILDIDLNDLWMCRFCQVLCVGGELKLCWSHLLKCKRINLRWFIWDDSFHMTCHVVNTWLWWWYCNFICMCLFMSYNFWHNLVLAITQKWRFISTITITSLLLQYELFMSCIHYFTCIRMSYVSFRCYWDSISIV